MICNVCSKWCFDGGVVTLKQKEKKRLRSEYGLEGWQNQLTSQNILTKFVFFFSFFSLMLLPVITINFWADVVGWFSSNNFVGACLHHLIPSVLEGTHLSSSLWGQWNEGQYAGAWCGKLLSPSLFPEVAAYGKGMFGLILTVVEHFAFNHCLFQSLVWALPRINEKKKDLSDYGKTTVYIILL